MQYNSMQAGKFKAVCLKVMEEIKKSGKGILITKRGVPIVKVTPVEEEEKSLFGSMRGTLEIKGDLLAPIEEEWNADH
jgi:antitoxin (DNA-binding transcriptional repressor) of toxin-antitoxin stability system